MTYGIRNREWLKQLGTRRRKAKAIIRYTKRGCSVVYKGKVIHRTKDSEGARAFLAGFNKTTFVNSNPRNKPRPASRKLRRTSARKNPYTIYNGAQTRTERTKRAAIARKKILDKVYPGYPARIRKLTRRITKVRRNPYRAYVVYAGEKPGYAKGLRRAGRVRGGKIRKWYWNGSALTLQKKFAEIFPNATTAHNVGKRIRGRILNSSLRNRFSCVGITSAV